MSVVRSVLFALVLASLPLSPLASLEALAAQQHIEHIGASRSAFVEAVRRATESFRDVRNVPPGYGAVLGCASGPEQGAMGAHFINPELLVDGVLDKSLPEALIHVWAWQDNPNGMFVDWNPKVSCEGQ